VGTSNGKQLTGHSSEARFFLEPLKPLHRQYEALRAYFVEGLPSAEAARRFGYTPGAFRVLCHQFRRTQDLQEHFFREIRHGPQAAPARDPVRELVVEMRKNNLSVYDIQQELATQGHSISINSLSVLLREEGFARLPRRRDEERPPSVKPEPAEVADVRQLDLTPRSFRTRVAGLFLFVPLMQPLDLAAVAHQAQLPGSKMVPAEQALRALLALKLIGKERKSHVMNLVFDQGLALFAGLNVMPKCAYLAAYSSNIGEQGIRRFMETWFDHLPENYHHATVRVLFDSLLDVTGKVDIEDTRIVVTLDKRAHNPFLVDSGLAKQHTPMPWLQGKRLVIDSQHAENCCEATHLDTGSIPTPPFSRPRGTIQAIASHRWLGKRVQALTRHPTSQNRTRVPSLPSIATIRVADETETHSTWDANRPNERLLTNGVVRRGCGGTLQQCSRRRIPSPYYLRLRYSN